MSDFILNGILWILALYGLIEIIKTIIYTCTSANLKPDGIYMIIAVKNQESKIEGFLRTTLFRLIYGKEENIKEVIITDLDSDDNTIAILQKLQKDYDFMQIVDWKQCKELLEQASKKE